MDKQFSFKLKVNRFDGTYTFTVPCENGFIITSQYCPNSLLGPDNVPYVWGEKEPEFIKDYNKIAEQTSTFAKDNPKLDTVDCFYHAVNKVAFFHAIRYGRLIFHDLLIYMDCSAHLMKAIGFKDSEIKRYYVTTLKKIVDEANDNIKDSTTLLPFKSSTYYKTLCSLV